MMSASQIGIQKESSRPPGVAAKLIGTRLVTRHGAVVAHRSIGRVVTLVVLLLAGVARWLRRKPRRRLPGSAPARECARGIEPSNQSQRGCSASSANSWAYSRGRRAAPRREWLQEVRWLQAQLQARQVRQGRM